MSNRVQHVTIVGGGTAGWLAAGILHAGLNRRGDGPDVRITVIESPNIPTVGVGEATTISMNLTLKQLGLDERDFIKQCNGSFKCAVKFANWNQDADGKPISFWHPFSRQGYLYGYNSVYHFLKASKSGGATDFGDAMFPSLAAIKDSRAPRGHDGADYDGIFPYAYHMDAALFAQYMTMYATNLGVEHVRDDVTKVNLDERGYVKSLSLKESGDWPVELVIDCTGFKGLIIKEALGEPFEPYAQHLLCDKALAVQIPYGESDKIESYTTSTGMNAGWSWRVPLYSRLGTGYVFSDNFRTDQEAMDEFMAFLGPQAKDAEPRAIGMRVGRTEKVWEKNCIAIGLSSGFIEPLESTAIFMVDMALQWLTNYFPDKNFNPVIQKRFNDRMRDLNYEIRDFIVLHYCTANRMDTPYWKAARNELQIPDAVQEDLEIFRHVLPRSEEMERGHLFSYLTYLIVLFGKGFFDDIEFPAERLVSRRDWKEYQRYLREVKSHLLQTLPDHYTLLNDIRSRAQDASPELPSTLLPDAATIASGADPLSPVITFKDDELSSGNIL